MPYACAVLRHPDELIHPIHRAIADCMAIYVFGSQVEGTANAQSDLDMAVLVPGYVTPLTLWRLASDLENIAGCPVDLLDLRAASTVMQHQVITNGRRIWARDAGTSDAFECFVLSEKNTLDTARAPLLREIQERGRVYG